MVAKDRIIFAVDVNDEAAAQQWIKTLENRVGWFKIGLELFTATGPKLVESVTSAGIRCFLDLKFHDIPNTVAGAVKSATALGAEMLTVHTSGGRDMLKAAADSASETAEKLGKPRPKIIGVSVLTSLGDQDMVELGFNRTATEQAARLAELAYQSGIDGMVCSPADLALVRSVVPRDFLVITPGIRPAGSAKGDQTRIATPASAIQAGSDLMVIGRPISQASDPQSAVAEIVAEIEAA